MMFGTRGPKNEICSNCQKKGRTETFPKRPSPLLRARSSGVETRAADFWHLAEVDEPVVLVRLALTR